jgi:hypothetical protein
MRTIAPVVCLAAALLSAAPTLAQEHVSTLVFPVVARTAGVGSSQWVTDLTVNNLFDSDVTLALQFFPENQANVFDPTFPTQMSLGARQTMLIEDVLATVFGYDSDIKGVLLVTVDADMIAGNHQDANIAGITRTYNAADPTGTYGQSVPGLAALAVTAAPIVATGARHDATYRSNVGIVSFSMSGQIRVHYRILGPTGGVLAEGSRTVPPVSMRQFSFGQLGVSAFEGAATVELWIDEGDVSQEPCEIGSAAILGYISKIDNGTGDAEFISAYLTEPDPCID